MLIMRYAYWLTKKKWDPNLYAYWVRLCLYRGCLYRGSIVHKLSLLIYFCLFKMRSNRRHTTSIKFRRTTLYQKSSNTTYHSRPMHTLTTKRMRAENTRTSRPGSRAPAYVFLFCPTWQRVRASNEITAQEVATYAI
jgi:hypothetical protein